MAPFLFPRLGRGLAFLTERERERGGERQRGREGARGERERDLLSLSEFGG